MFETFVRCHIAFSSGGRARNAFMTIYTAVAEHDGRIVRFNPHSWHLPVSWIFIPSLQQAAGWEKSKVENGVGTSGTLASAHLHGSCRCQLSGPAMG
jgi:hypothetical protein